MKRMKHLAAMTSVVSFAATWLSFAAAQTTQNTSATAVSVRVDVVNVLATVRDKKGALVTDLSRDDFTLTEDGQPQEIRYFSKESAQPLTLGLLVDTSLSQRSVLDQERSASLAFLDQIVRESIDKAFLIRFDSEVELLQDVTSSHHELEGAVALLRAPQPNESSGNSSDTTQDQEQTQGSHGSARRGTHGAGTLLYDAIYLASDELMKKLTGRKVLVVLSDGVDHGSKETLETAIETAQRSDTIVYSIFSKGENYYPSNHMGFGFPGGGMGGGMGRHGGGPRGYPQQESRPDGKKVLQQIAEQTGGRLFEVSKKLPVDQIYTDIEQELHSQYNLGYTPVEGTAAGYHKLQLTTKKKDLLVQAREGYYLNSAK